MSRAILAFAMVSQLNQLAAELRRAQETRSPCPPLRGRLPEGDVDAAYKVQQANTDFWVAAGRRIVGRKIGLTSPAVQKQLGVSQPDCGVLYADMAVGDGAALRVDSLLQPKVEAEIALVLDRSLTVTNPTAADVLRATAYVVPAIEIVASRIANWDIGIVDTIADNASSGAFALGGPARRIDGIDLTGCAMRTRIGEAVVSSGSGRDCLGSPLNAAVWLATRMQEVGMPLQAGDVILTGALGKMAAVRKGDTVAAEIAGIGTVSVTFE